MVRYSLANFLIFGVIHGLHFGVDHYATFDLWYVGAEILFDLLLIDLTLLVKDLFTLAIIDDATLLLGRVLALLFYLALILGAADFFGLGSTLLFLSRKK